MTILLLILFVAAAVVMGVILLYWARANYPRTRRWLISRIVSSFVSGFILGIMMVASPSVNNNLWSVPLLTGCAFCVLFTLLVPINLRRLIPPDD
jgi:peptidoglycan/LPS O-acetylase OafA/YrhL